jgi:hypothetical protein
MEGDDNKQDRYFMYNVILRRIRHLFLPWETISITYLCVCVCVRTRARGLVLCSTSDAIPICGAGTILTEKNGLQNPLISGFKLQNAWGNQG